MAEDKINIYKRNQKYLFNEDIQRKITAEINNQIPNLVKELLEEEEYVPEQIRITTNKLPKSIRKEIATRKRNQSSSSYPNILIDIIDESFTSNETNLTKKIQDIIENESATQLYYLKETLAQLDEFLLSLKVANDLD
ncbi:hypothetical protein [Enterococcus alishanensis]